MHQLIPQTCKKLLSALIVLLYFSLVSVCQVERRQRGACDPNCHFATIHRDPVLHKTDLVTRTLAATCAVFLFFFVAIFLPGFHASSHSATCGRPAGSAPCERVQLRCSWLQCKPGRQVGFFLGSTARSQLPGVFNDRPNDSLERLRKLAAKSRQACVSLCFSCCHALLKYSSFTFAWQTTADIPAAFRSECTSDTGNGRSWSLVEIFLQNSIIIFLFFFPPPPTWLPIVYSVFFHVPFNGRVCVFSAFAGPRWSSLLVINLTGR